MAKQLIEDIVRILLTIYGVPTQFVICGLISLYLFQAVLPSIGGWAFFILIFAIICFIADALILIYAIDKFVDTVHKFFKKVIRFFKKLLRK